MVIDYADDDHRYDIFVLDTLSNKIDILYNNGDYTFTKHTISLPIILGL